MRGIFAIRPSRRTGASAPNGFNQKHLSDQHRNADLPARYTPASEAMPKPDPATGAKLARRVERNR